jgi:membrane-bound acyltransferase YfiQ involved in biofilm formation
MMRRLLLLSGLAILAVVSNHAAGWGYVAMFWWTDRYRPVTVPNYEQLGSLPYYALLAIRQLTVFAVPTFLFVSGFFIAYSARGTHPTLNWKVIRTRLADILVPFFVWSVVFLLVDSFIGDKRSPVTYLYEVLFGASAYFYIPLVCQFYLLSPFLVSAAKTRGKLLLLICGIVQLSLVLVKYPSLFGVQAASLDLINTLPVSLFINWIFFFALGLVAGFNSDQFRQHLGQLKWALLAAVIALGLLAIAEPEMIYRATGIDWRGGVATASTNLYAVAFVLCFLAFDKIQIPLSNLMAQFGSRIYGIYLVHPQVLTLVAKAVYHFVPGLLASQILFQPLLVISGLATPLLLMAAVARSPARRTFRYLFG